MPRPSKIDRLPQEVRDLIAELRGQGRTLDEILDKLRELAVDVSRSGLHRHIQDIEKLSEQIQSSRAIAEALIKRHGEAPESRTARLNIELLHSIIMRTYASGDGGPIQLTPKETQCLADALHRLARASRDDLETTIRLRREVVDQAAKAAEKAARAKGLSAETVDAIKAEILGIKQ